MILNTCLLVSHLVRTLVHAEDPFRVAPRVVERTLGAAADVDAVWRRYDGEGCFVELGPFEGRTPKKIAIVLRVRTREEAAESIDALNESLPAAPNPHFPFHQYGAFDYRGTLQVSPGSLIGIESSFEEDDEGWQFTLILISGGPRVVFENQVSSR